MGSGGLSAYGVARNEIALFVSASLLGWAGDLENKPIVMDIAARRFRHPDPGFVKRTSGCIVVRTKLTIAGTLLHLFGVR